MGAYKKLNRQDVFVSDYVARKQWEASGSLITSYGIESLRGIAASASGYSYPQDYRNGRYETLVYSSISHSYYAGRVGDGIFSGSRDLSLQTTLTLSGSRNLRSEVAVISIPKDVYGTHIEPGTFVLQPFTLDVDKYILDGYCIDPSTGDNLYIENIGNLYGAGTINTADYLISESFYVTESIIGAPGQYVDVPSIYSSGSTSVGSLQQRIEIVDDTNGGLIISGSGGTYTRPIRNIGDIIYNQGLAILTDPDIARYYNTYIDPKVKWKSNQPIYTYNVYCTVRDSEMNFTYNPSALSGSYGDLANNVTGSTFTPYVTTIGLYNSANELIAVAKTNRPIPKSQNADMTFVVKIDL